MGTSPGNLVACVPFAVVMWILFWTIGGGQQALPEYRRPPYAQTTAVVKGMHLTRVGRRGSGLTPDLQFVFTVQGHEYTQSTVGEHWYQAPSMQRDEGDAFKVDFAAGKKIPVMYDPSDPSQCYAVLPEKYVGTNNLGGFLWTGGCAILMSGLSIVGAVCVWKRRNGA